RASSSAPLPFWRLTITATSNADHCPSARSPSEAIRMSCCHGSNISPADAASSTASCPADDAYSGWLATRGLRAPCSTLVGEVIDSRPPVRIRQPIQLADHVSQLLCECGHIAALRIPELARHVVADRFQ